MLIQKQLPLRPKLSNSHSFVSTLQVILLPYPDYILCYADRSKILNKISQMRYPYSIASAWRTSILKCLTRTIWISTNPHSSFKYPSSKHALNPSFLHFTSSPSLTSTQSFYGSHRDVGAKNANTTLSCNLHLHIIGQILSLLYTKTRVLLLVKSTKTVSFEQSKKNQNPKRKHRREEIIITHMRIGHMLTSPIFKLDWTTEWWTIRIFFVFFV